MSKKARKPEVVRGMSGSVEDMVNCVMNNPALTAQMQGLGFKSKNPDGMTFQEAMICSQIANAVKGDLKAYKAVMELAGIKKKTPIEEMANGLVGEDLEIFD